MIYARLALDQVPRMFGLIDRDPLSATYGCAHRAYWLHRTSDFPSSVCQQACSALAMLWSSPLEPRYHRNPAVLQWALSSVRFALQTQKKDGSFDEWYPNERGWAGPGAYLLVAMLRARELIGAEFPRELDSGLQEATRRAALHLIHHEERDVLANHQALAVAAVQGAVNYLGNPSELQEGVWSLWERFEKSCHEEGWSLEYDGPDAGYLSGTLSFLARLHRMLSPQSELKQRVERVAGRGLDYLSYHLGPGGNFAGAVGSRHTSNIFVFGPEYWADRFPIAARMARWCRSAAETGKLIRPADQEDHYLLYRLPEFLEAALLKRDGPFPERLLPYEREDFSSEFPHAGLVAVRRKPHYFLFGLKRGGVVRAYRTEPEERAGLLCADDGIAVKDKRGRIYTSLWCHPGSASLQQDSGVWLVSERAQRLKSPVFSPWGGLLFRFTMLTVGWNSFFAKTLKAWIRGLLTTGSRPGPFRFSREIEIGSETLRIRTSLARARSSWPPRSVQIGGALSPRFVPQSRYFENPQLSGDQVVLSGGQLADLIRGRELTHERTVELK